MKKRIIVLLLIVASVIATTAIVYAANSGQADGSNSYDYDVAHEPSMRDMVETTNCTETQFALLQELMRGGGIMPFSFDGEYVDAPRINLIVPPEGNRNYFLIGVESEPTERCIEIILAYAGIPSSLAVVAKAVGTREFNPYAFIDYNYEIPLSEESEYIEPVPFGTYSMGTRVRLAGIDAALTMGHPTCINGTSFLLAIHSNSSAHLGRHVYLFGTNTRIGYISRVYFEPRRDIAIVNMIGSHRVMPFIDGGMISDFRARASIHDSTLSPRGFSPWHWGHVSSLSATGRFPGDPFYFEHKIAVSPNGNSIEGDSGTGLIRRMSSTDRAVLGTRSGRFVLNGVQVGIYTHVLNY